MSVMAFLWLRKLFGVDKTPKKYTSTFRSTDGQEREFSYWFNVNEFKSNPERFNMNIARISMAKSMASYNGCGDYATRDRHIRRFHETLGFEHIESNIYYQQEPTFDSIGVQFGYRVFRQGLHKVALISIGIRYGGYESEWGSNFLFGEEGHHHGFEVAAKQVMEEFQRYFTKHDLKKYRHIKIWVAGFSRGGAVANLVGAKFLSLFKRDKDKVFSCSLPQFHKNMIGEVYAYTFEAPCPAIIQAHSSSFDSIFNIFSPSDIVPYTPFPFMGFTRYGTLITKSIHMDDVKDIQDYLPNLKVKEFKVKELSKISVIDSEMQYSDEAFIQELLRFFEKEVHVTRKDYVERYQIGIARAAAFIKSSSKEQTKKMSANVKLPSILAAIVMQRSFNKLLRGIVEETGRPFDEERLEETCVYLRNLVLDLIKADRPNHFVHLVTAISSGSAIFQNHAIELIYSYLLHHDLSSQKIVPYEK